MFLPKQSRQARRNHIVNVKNVCLFEAFGKEPMLKGILIFRKIDRATSEDACLPALIVTFDEADGSISRMGVKSIRQAYGSSGGRGS
ncbi:hypothetical protein JL39_04515 [Rhizobium sp. YS-1r]|nr:hypothetical protein JL39_04515 [Rhizobium sp. YS-1r]